MILSTMNDLPGYDVTEVIGEVFGITVRSRNVGSSPGTASKSWPAVSCAERPGCCPTSRDRDPGRAD